MKQCDRCKSSICNYTQSRLFRITIEILRQCAELSLGGIGFRGIERLTGFAHVTVMRRVKKLSDDIARFRPQAGEIESINVMALNEMWHFVQKRINAGSC